MFDVTLLTSGTSCGRCDCATLIRVLHQPSVALQSVSSTAAYPGMWYNQPAVAVQSALC